jgi:hypothetical protein
MRIRSHNTGLNPRLFGAEAKPPYLEELSLRNVVAQATSWADDGHFIISVADRGYESGIQDGKIIWIRIRDEHPRLFFREPTVFGLKIVNFFDEDPDPGPGIFLTLDPE